MRSLLGFPINKILGKIKNKKMHDCIITSSRIPNIYIIHSNSLLLRYAVYLFKKNLCLILIKLASPIYYYYPKYS